MKTQKELIEQVLDYARAARQKYLPDVKDEDLCDNGAFYYMNGNDTTDFDWNWNGRVCEIMQFYKTTNLGLLKVYPHSDGYIYGYIYGDEGREQAIEITPEYIGVKEAKKLKEYLEARFDDNELWDEIIKDQEEYQLYDCLSQTIRF